MAIIHLVFGNEYFCIDGSFQEMHDVIAVALLVLNIICFSLSDYFTWLFGLSGFDVLACPGPYAVGYKLFFMRGLQKNPVRVFYPVDRSFEKKALFYGEEAFKPYLDFARIPQFFQAQQLSQTFARRYQKAGGSLHLPPFSPSAPYSSFLEQLRVPSITCAHLAEKYGSGQEKLVPVILSHAQLTSGFLYQYAGHFLASFGYLVLIPDHAICGSASHLETERCEVMSYDPRLRLQGEVRAAFEDTIGGGGVRGSAVEE